MSIATKAKGLFEPYFWKIRFFPWQFFGVVLNFFSRTRYQLINENQLKQLKTSNRVFILGSGYSTLQLTSQNWASVSEANTISFREFPRQNWVRADFHLTAEIDFIGEYGRRIANNPLYSQCAMVVQSGWTAHAGNLLLGLRILRKGTRVFRFRRTTNVNFLPSERLDQGLAHYFNSVTDCVNLAFLLGYTEIILIGVDLNNKQYFWLPPEEKRTYEKPGITATGPFPNLKRVVQLFSDWRKFLNQRGVQIKVVNPQSALAEVLPIHQWH
jgi:hypothetical protein